MITMLSNVLANYDMVDLQRAVNIAWIYHKNQIRKDGSKYIFHPLQVMLNVKSIPAKIVAVCHDLLEDTEITIPILSSFIGYELTERVAALTRDELQTYDSYIDHIVELNDPIVTEVKIEDLRHNLNTIDNIPSPKRERLYGQYQGALGKLLYFQQ